jgi:hypothetical protein
MKLNRRFSLVAATCSVRLPPALVIWGHDYFRQFGQLRQDPERQQFATGRTGAALFFLNRPAQPVRKKGSVAK